MLKGENPGNKGAEWAKRPGLERGGTRRVINQRRSVLHIRKEKIRNASEKGFRGNAVFQNGARQDSEFTGGPACVKSKMVIGEKREKGFHPLKKGEK